MSRRRRRAYGFWLWFTITLLAIMSAVLLSFIDATSWRVF